jgi:cell division septation protein DedD
VGAPRGRGLRPGGVVRALGRLVALVCVGFALGLIFGLVTEEPQLLAGHLRGEGESVVLESSGGDAGANDALDRELAESLASTENIEGEALQAQDATYASAATEVRAMRPSVTPSERTGGLPAVASHGLTAANSESLVAAKVALPESARVIRQAPQSESTSASRSVTAATAWAIQVGAFSDRAAADQLADGLRGRYPVTVLPANRQGGRWRVRVEPISGEGLARETAERLKSEEGLPTWVTKSEGRSGS